MPFGNTLSKPSSQTPINPFLESRVAIFRGKPDYRCADVAIRGALSALGLDVEQPFEGFIRPGDCVLLKPNLIRESHLTRPDEWQQIITHGEIIRVVAGLVAQALNGKGRIIVADGPQTDSDFEQICTRTGLPEIAGQVRRSGVRCDLIDLRRDRWFQKGDVIYKRIQLSGDPAGYTTVDLGDASEFFSYPLSGHFYGADYDMNDTARYHTGGHHRYVLCRTALDADVIINLPKLKTHKKTGVTISLKNMVGVNGYRNCLPHFTVGTVRERGDEFQSAGIRSQVESRAILGFKSALVASGRQGGATARMVKRIGRAVFGDTNSVVRSGNWYGNDTIWRTVLDLNKVLLYFKGNGERRQHPVRYLTIVDGVVAGEGNGPLAPDAVPCGVVLAGFNPIAVDAVAALLMGFDDAKIPLLAGAWKIKQYPLAHFSRDSIFCVSNVEEWNGMLESISQASHLGMEPHFGWRGRIERATIQAVTR